MIAAGVVYVYVAYSAFAISRTLSNGVYRRQALGMAVVIVFLIILGESTDFNGTSGAVPTVDFVLGFLAFYAVFIGTYYWIDASIVAIRFTDPLYRDTFHWTRLRLVFWAYDIAALVFFLITGTLGIFQFSTAPDIVVAFILGPLVIMLFSGAVVLPVASHRSKDKVMKRHLDWFAVYVIAILGFIFVVSLNNFQTMLAATIGGYLLYRSVRSLVPLYTFRPESDKANAGPGSSSEQEPSRNIPGARRPSSRTPGQPAP